METQISPPNSTKRGPENMKSCGLSKSNQVGTVMLYGIPIVSLFIESQERLCLAQISNTLLKHFSYNEIHNRRVALGITCVQCTPVQLEILRRAGAMPVSSRRCGMITRREAERLCKSFLGDNAPPRLPDDFAFSVYHECAWGCRGSFLPSRYNSSRAKCIKCFYCGLFFSPNKFIFHSHRMGPTDKYVQPDAANFNSWRRHMKLFGGPPQDISYAWEDVKAMFNGGTRKRVCGEGSSEGGGGGGGGRGTPQSARGSANSVPLSPKRIKLSSSSPSSVAHSHGSSTPHSMQSLSPPYGNVKPLHIPHSTASLMANSGSVTTPRFQAGLTADLPIPFSRSFMMDYMWHQNNVQHSMKVGGSGAGVASPSSSNIPTLPPGSVSTPPFPIPPYAIPWLKRPSALFFPPGNGLSGASGVGGASNEMPGSFIDSKTFSFYNNSAFKPVNGQLNRTVQETPVGVMKHSYVKEPVSSDEEDNPTGFHQNKKPGLLLSKSVSVEPEGGEEEEEDDEILVDIETTEDDAIQLKASPASPPPPPPPAIPSPKLFPRPPSSSGRSTPTILQLDPNNNDPLKRSSRTTPNHMPSTLPATSGCGGMPVTTGNALLATPLKDDSTQSKTTSHSPPSLPSTTLAVPNFPSPSNGGVHSTTIRTNSPIPLPIPTTTSNSCTGGNHNSGELWSVARLTLERNAVVAAAAAAAEQHHHHLNGYYQQHHHQQQQQPQGENLIAHKSSSGSSASPDSMSPPIYAHRHHHHHHIPGAGPPSTTASIQKPIATFYRHELAKQFQLYRTHHNHLQLTHPAVVEGATATGVSSSSQPNGVV